MNYKIRVANEAESKEVQDFAKSAGYSRKYNNFTLHNGWVCLSSDSYILCVCQSQAGSELNDYKEITISELRDLVVLKRNLIDDATHEDQHGDKWVCLFGVWNFYTGKGKWDSCLSSSMSRYELKPIKKEVEMKEYLVKINGAYKLCNLLAEDVTDEYMEVPEGAEVAFQASSNSTVVFKRSECGYSNAAIVWKRETLNNKVASAEAARQSGVFVGTPFSDLPEFNFEVVDDFVESNVEQTLSDRESTYGSFSDVADTTSKLMGVLLNSKNGQMLPCTHQEALHMICSKMARIVNGDCNYKDNWHDIAGYATLVVKDINGNP